MNSRHNLQIALVCEYNPNVQGSSVKDSENVDYCTYSKWQHRIRLWKANGQFSSCHRRGKRCTLITSEEGRWTDRYISCRLISRKHQSHLPLKLPSWTCFFCLRGESGQEPLCGAAEKQEGGSEKGPSGHHRLPDSNEPAPRLSVPACRSAVGANRTNSFHAQWVCEITRTPKSCKSGAPSWQNTNFVSVQFY